jgi:hypothetical protein
MESNLIRVAMKKVDDIPVGLLDTEGSVLRVDNKAIHRRVPVLVAAWHIDIDPVMPPRMQRGTTMGRASLWVLVQIVGAAVALSDSAIPPHNIEFAVDAEPSFSLSLK